MLTLYTANVHCVWAAYTVTAFVCVLVLEVDGLCSQSAENAHIVPVSIQSVLERVDRRRVHDLLW